MHAGLTVVKRSSPQEFGTGIGQPVPCRVGYHLPMRAIIGAHFPKDRVGLRRTEFNTIDHSRSMERERLRGVVHQVLRTLEHLYHVETRIVSHIRMITEDDNVPGLVGRIPVSYECWVCGIADVDDLETGNLIRYEGKIAGNGNTVGRARRIIVTCECRVRRITDVDHLKTRVRVRHIGVIAGDTQVKSEVGRIVAADEGWAGGITDIDDIKTG